MKHFKLKPSVKKNLRVFLVPTTYATIASVFIFGIIFFQHSVNSPAITDVPTTPVINSPVAPVDRETRPTVILKPFKGEGVETVKTFYDYQADEAAQQLGIVYFERTYLQNKGMDFSSDAEFEVVAIMDGTVVEVKEDNIMGKTIVIKHSDDLTSEYKSLGEVSVKEDDKVTAGQVIAKSGTNKINPDSKHHLYFAIVYKNNFVNPESYFNKRLDEL